MTSLWGLVFAIAIFLPSCSNQSKEELTKNLMLPDSLYSHFPRNNTNLKLESETTNAKKTDLPYFAEEFETTFLLKVYEYKDKSVLKNMAKYIANPSIKRINSLDTNYIVIGSERDLFNRFDNETLNLMWKNNETSNLLPDFTEILNERRDLLSSITLCGLSEDFELYIIKSGSDYVLPEKYRYEWNVLPQKERHGYSSGVAMNKKKRNLIYWTIAW